MNSVYEIIPQLSSGSLPCLRTSHELQHFQTHCIKLNPITTDLSFPLALFFPSHMCHTIFAPSSPHTPPPLYILYVATSAFGCGNVAKINVSEIEIPNLMFLQL